MPGNDDPVFDQPCPAGRIPIFRGRYHCISLISAQAKQAAKLLKINRKVSNEKARNVLNWTPIADKETAILASLESLVKLDLIK